MKYLKTYESIFNYEVGIFTMDEASELYRTFLKKHDYNYNLKSKIHYFSEFSSWSASEEFKKHCRFIIAYNDIDILGVCQFSYWGSSDHYAISYCSANEDYFKQGVSKKLLETLFKYFSENYPNETLNFSGYSIEGWKYLRKYILEYSGKYNVKIFEKGVEYPGKDGKHNDEFYELIRKSREEVENIYGKIY